MKTIPQPHCITAVNKAPEDLSKTLKVKLQELLQKQMYAQNSESKASGTSSKTNVCTLHKPNLGNAREQKVITVSSQYTCKCTTKEHKQTF